MTNVINHHKSKHIPGETTLVYQHTAWIKPAVEKIGVKFQKTDKLKIAI